jgi:hypothetical protein
VLSCDSTCRIPLKEAPNSPGPALDDGPGLLLLLLLLLSSLKPLVCAWAGAWVCAMLLVPLLLLVPAAAAGVK